MVVSAGVAKRGHKCPCDGCDVVLPYHLLMCRPHWRRVPRPTAAEVNDAWREYQKGSTAQTWVRYLNARTGAIDAVNKKIAADAAAAEGKLP